MYQKRLQIKKTQKKPKKPKKNQKNPIKPKKNPKKPAGLVFFKKTRFLANPVLNMVSSYHF